jgi:hypothetical protein
MSNFEGSQNFVKLVIANFFVRSVEKWHDLNSFIFNVFCQKKIGKSAIFNSGLIHATKKTNTIKKYCWICRHFWKKELRGSSYWMNDFVSFRFCIWSCLLSILFFHPFFIVTAYLLSLKEWNKQHCFQKHFISYLYNVDWICSKVNVLKTWHVVMYDY